MKFCLIVSSVLLLLIVDSAYGVGGDKSDAAAATAASTPSPSSKTTDKMAYPKKVTSLKKKPTKSPLSSVTTKATPSKKALKKAADVTAAFKDLPEDDLDFIKELDKQFKVHGDKIKIKVENDNATDTKNSKRTIEGELGYGYQHNGYEYTRPKFMFYPYSQEDIPKGAPGYYPNYDKTSVTIEPSYSYELKPQAYEQEALQHDQHQIDLPQPEGHSEEHQQQQHAHQPEPQQQQYEEPVIVLRIPGPAKYASHLQTLLQQYLEIRASQYLRILEEAEQRKQQSESHQEPEQHAPQVQHYEQPQAAYEAPAHPGAHEAQHYAQAAPEEQQHYTQEVAYAHQVAPTPQSVSYPDIDDVYHNYKGRHHGHQQQQQQHQSQQSHQAPQPQTAAYYTQAHAYHAAQQQQQQLEQEQHQQHQQQLQQHEEAPQYYYMHQQQYEQSPGHAYQHVYLISMAPQSPYDAVDAHEHHQHVQQQQQHQQQHLTQQPIYVQEEEAPAQPAAHEHEHAHAHSLSQPLSENSPRKTHTKVIFTHNSEQGAADYHGAYTLPSIRPYERHAPTSTPSYQQHAQQQHAQQQPHYEQPHPQQLEAESADYQQHVATHTHQQQQESAAASAQHDHQQQQQTVAITQRPFNYHAHALKVRMRAGAHKRDSTKDASVAASNIKTTTVAESEHQLQNIRSFVRDKFGAKMGSAVEFKTTQLVEG